MVMAFVALSMGLALSSCSKDDKDEPTPVTGNIVGTWVSTVTETEIDGTTTTYSLTLRFNDDGTGYIYSQMYSSNGNSSTNNSNFHYTVATASDGVMNVTIVYDADLSSERWSVTQTGNTLLVSEPDGNYIYTRK